MASKIEKIVIDTNVFISFLISDSFSKLDKYLQNNKVRLLFSEELLSEFIEVTSRPKLKKYFSEKDISKLLDSIHNYADFIEVESIVTICRDEKDNFLLSLCADGKADYLITGDDDLLTLKKFKKTTIIKIADYLKK
ncbi:MAG: putative toxin-antitoxin system toxin component, PIN family [Bacteroidetes bacterium]|nr:putative toxin-antitoxin system toxin component, PIN family [Bacteroidota bacterium]